MPDGSAFNEFYYRNCCGQPYERNETWLAFFAAIADRILFLEDGLIVKELRDASQQDVLAVMNSLTA